ncbi:hypothetical protein [Halostagnicola sp. A56]|uniref:hypothetical protein n=1 Tax=Halostagnicola sp. A56 TaxID=1495067 RepID=UPI0012E1958B|nr:hypothetical protein [Halostagnicola sp. A56]
MSERPKHALVGLIASLAVIGAILGAGIGVGAAGAVSDASTGSIEQGVVGTSNETEVTLAGTATTSSHPDNIVVVRLGDGLVVSGKSVNETSDQTFLRHESGNIREENLVVSGWRGQDVVQYNGEPIEVRDSEEHIVYSDGESPDLITEDSSTPIEINPNTGTLQTRAAEATEGIPIVDAQNGEEITYRNFGEPVLESEITNINDPAEGENLIVNATISNDGFQYFTGTPTLSWYDGDSGEWSDVGENYVVIDPDEEEEISFEIGTEEGDSSVTEIRLDADDSREFGDSRDSQDIEIEAAE